MADDGSAEGALWPLPEFCFQVEWDSMGMRFQEVSGLDAEAQPIEYRHGDSPAFSTVKVPGLRKAGNVTLKRGVVASGDGFRDWCFRIRMNTIQRQALTIRLRDESGAPTMVWILASAWPVKITGTDLEQYNTVRPHESLGDISPIEFQTHRGHADVSSYAWT
jgi:phage tail-like protein